MERLENFNDLYETTINNFNNITKEDAMRIIRELVHTLEDDNVSGVDLEQTMDYINDILGLEDIKKGE